MAKNRPAQREPSAKEIWQTAESVDDLFRAAQGRLSPRHLRLFAIACCKALWGKSRLDGYSELLQLAERMADCGTGQGMHELSSQAVRYRRVAYPHGVIRLIGEDAKRAASEWAHMMGLSKPQSHRLADVLREIAGDPFADIRLDRAIAGWRDGAIPKLAQACYASNDFSTIGILGDALEEAGCSERAILEHARAEQTHYRGCWLVDLILGNTEPTRVDRRSAKSPVELNRSAVVKLLVWLP